MASTRTADDPQWYKDSVFYEVRVRSFADSDGDGVGDFNGLTSRLDYLQELGVTTLWLLPFYPSPLRDDGYDISDYTDVHPDLGTLKDFKNFLREAHRRGLRVVTELVLNHTSDQHPWFQRARKARPGSSHHDFYVWSDDPNKYREARIIFKDFEKSNWTWDPVAKRYFWHRFFSHQPDLNFDNPEVRRTMRGLVDFWFNLGVDGLRLDAVPYLFEREGTNCENLRETHDFLRELRKHVDARFKNRMLLAEANQWPDDAVAYFGSGDECHMAFHFPIMPRLFMSIHMEDRFPIVDILKQTPVIPDNSQWALFLRNHDELTLEMVTDEERDYMYRVYAHDPQARINLGIRRRLAPLLGNNRRKIELMNGLLCSLPGTPVIYYGDEIGMGDNIYLGDRNGVRTPMHWTGDRNAGYSRANPQKLYLPVIVDPEYHYEACNVEAQQSNPHSLLWWMRRLIALRTRYKAFGRGTIQFLSPANPKVLVFVRAWQEQTILVVANLSRFVQPAEIDLSAFKGSVPMELFGQVKFPPVGDLPYFLTLGPHSFYWFELRPQPVAAPAPASAPQAPVIEVDGPWESVLSDRIRASVEALLPDVLRQRRWFGGKARQLRTARIIDTVPVALDGSVAQVALVRVEYADANPEVYVLPLAFAERRRAQDLNSALTSAVIASLTVRDGSGTIEGVLYEATVEPAFHATLLDAIARRRGFHGAAGVITTEKLKGFGPLRGGECVSLEPKAVGGEQSNSSVVFGDRFIMKIFRRLDEGLNPDLEIGRFLTEVARFPHTAPLAGVLNYQRGRENPMAIGLLQGFVPNEGDAWRAAVDELARYVERALAADAAGSTPDGPVGSVVDLAYREIPAGMKTAIGAYLEWARLLGQRTAELHRALASDDSHPEFSPEPFTPFSQRALYQSLRTSAQKVFQLLARRVDEVPPESKADAQKIVGLEDKVLSYLGEIRTRKITATQIRCHGDYHLGQVLFTGKDFIIIDFEGEPARSLGERRLKRSPLRDVAGMLRSYHYAGYSVFFNVRSRGELTPERLARLEAWLRSWIAWVQATFLRAYLDAAKDASFVPPEKKELELLLNVFLLEKAVYEIGYELNNRPAWIRIPFQGIIQLMESRGS